MQGKYYYLLVMGYNGSVYWAGSKELDEAKEELKTRLPAKVCGESLQGYLKLIEVVNEYEPVYWEMSDRGNVASVENGRLVDSQELWIIA